MLLTSDAPLRPLGRPLTSVAFFATLLFRETYRIPLVAGSSRLDKVFAYRPRRGLTLCWRKGEDRAAISHSIPGGAMQILFIGRLISLLTVVAIAVGDIGRPAGQHSLARCGGTALRPLS